MTQSFDEWFLNQYKCLDDDKFDSCEDAWNAGAQSRQAEIDDLQKRIDLIVDLVRDNTPDYWLDNMIQDILKGTTNEQ